MSGNLKNKFKQDLSRKCSAWKDFKKILGPKKGGKAIVNSKHFVKDRLGMDIIINQSVQCKHSQSMDQSETRESSTVFG